MTHTYHITGMTCTGCQAKVLSLLQNVPGVTNVDVKLETNEAIIGMNKHVPTQDLQAALAPYPKYTLTEDLKPVIKNIIPTDAEDNRSFLTTYKPVLLVFGYIAVISTLIAGANEHFDWMMAMRTFMGGFFLVFSFFKLLNLDAFADSYAMYDIVAAKFKPWGYIYAFIELGLGLAYVINFNPFVTNLVTLIIMSVSIVGVLQSVLNKRKIQCACLGAVFNLPMSTLTIIEDGLMIAMSITMLIAM
jgi:copper chaperone CopZ